MLAMVRLSHFFLFCNCTRFCASPRARSTDTIQSRSLNLTAVIFSTHIGIVPLSVTFLEGARANVRLNGVWHSPDAKGPWYGNERVVRYWSQFLK